MNPVLLLRQLHCNGKLKTEVTIRGDFIIISGHYFNKDAIAIKNDSEEVSDFYTLGGLFHFLEVVQKFDLHIVAFIPEENKDVNLPFVIKRQMSEDTEEKFPLMLLPDELIVHILSYLKQTYIATKMSRVNKRMNKICLDPDLWTRLVLPSEDRLSLEAAFDVVNRCKKLKQLDVWKRREDGDMLALEVFGRSKDLKEKGPLKKLTVDKCSVPLLQAISGSSLTGLQIREASQILVDNMVHLSNLTELILSQGRWLYYYNWEIRSNKLLEEIGLHCRNLKIFRFDGKTTAEGVTSLLLGGLWCTLRELSFSYLLIHEDTSVVSTCPALAQCVKLIKLRASLPRISSTISQRDFNLICNNLHRLQDLQLDCCDQLTSADYISAFWDWKLFNIVKLKLSNCRDLDDDVLQVVAKNCPNLTHLSLSFNKEITNIGLKLILTNCRKLKKLELYDVRNMEKVWRNGKCQVKPRSLTEMLEGVAPYGTFTKGDIEGTARETSQCMVYLTL